MFLIQVGVTLLIILLIGGGIFLFLQFLHAKYTSYQLLQKALANSEFLKQFNDSEELRDLARRLGSVGQFEKSLLAWNRYQQLVGDSVEARGEKGEIFYQQQKYDRALEELKAAAAGEGEVFPDVDLYLGRTYREKGNIEKALEVYHRYLDNVPGNLNFAFEVAETAQEGQKLDRAREIYNMVRDRGVRELYVMATLELVKMELDNNITKKVADYLKELYKLDKQGKLPPGRGLETRYQHARLLEQKNNLDEALRIYQRIYKSQPDYKDVGRKIANYIENLGDKEILAEYIESDHQNFFEISRRIVEIRGYEPESKFQIKKGEIEITALCSTGFWKEDRVLFSFKKWKSPANEWPLREFELKAIEKNVSGGYFVSPGGFKPEAVKFARRTDIIELIGPDELINYLPQIKKEKFK